MFSLKNIYKTISLALLLVCVGLITINEVNAKVNAKKERVRMKLYYSKNDAGERMISIGLTAGSGKKMHGVKNGEVLLTSVLNDSIFVLATLETDTLGVVNLYLAQDYKLPMDEDGKSVIEVSYDGNEIYRSASNDIEIFDIDLEFTFEIEDSVKYLSVAANKIDGKGNKIPVEELDIFIGVQRLYSVLPIDDAETDEDGIGMLEIPDDLPGDADGNLIFVAKIEDHDEFGTVTKSGNQAWGIPVSYEVKPLPRQLFTDEAPLWMIASVFIMLLGAWYHFFLSISK
ncbi:MAG: hypothetical protein KAQ62_25210, partial [Cyclobacteriaceae bacterium]|nr:hypothetical protein [Cyclobacteriaceae bacterium]